MTKVPKTVFNTDTGREFQRTYIQRRAIAKVTLGAKEIFKNIL
jgi:hypothetical protein